ncbi:8-oxo-dGTP diphosphatase [Lachnospiraceae bacterium]|nr:8-oxo-dGTP diphosphatase [Lachnospiraceae bacterium]
MKGYAQMNLTTLCYIEQNGCYLMMHRTKKSQDVNEGKWIGVGGKFEEDETPEECLLREVKEETGLTLLNYRYRGILTFIAEGWESEYIFLYTATEFEGTLSECREGDLKWIQKDALWGLSLWEGDKIFLRLLLEDAGFFSLKLTYQGDTLTDSKLVLI